MEQTYRKQVTLLLNVLPEVAKEKCFTIHRSLTDMDKAFLLSAKNVTPDWSIYDFERFPALAWKLRNLQRLKESNPDKHKEQYNTLEKKLNA